VTGLSLSLGEGTLAGYLIALARVAGFVLVAPPFNTRSVPPMARGGVALVLAVPLSTWTVPGAPRLDSGELMLRSLTQVLLGAILGYLVALAVAAVQAIGDLLDVVGGFSMSVAMDPLMLVQISVMGRIHQLVAVTLLFVTDGHLMVLQGLARSVQLMPDPHLNWDQVGRAVTADVAGMFVAALQVAAPLVAATLVADIALGLLTRAAPALNAFSLGFPLKILLTLMLAGLVIAQLPDVLRATVSHATGTILELTGGG
jgi:flagellar biosynthesis protein FliR